MSLVVEYRIAQGRTETGRRTVVIDGGAVVDAHDGAAEAPDVVVRLTPALAEQVRARTLDVGAGFMRGEIKTDGDFGALLHALPVLHRDPGLG